MASDESSTSSQKQLHDIEEPADTDVLCGLGEVTVKHSGNRKFRKIIRLNVDLFRDSSERQRLTIARSIVASTRQTTPSGRFLQQDPSTGLWFDIGDEEATAKTISALSGGGSVEGVSGEMEVFSSDGAKATGKASEGKRKFDENEEKPLVNVPHANPTQTLHRRTQTDPEVDFKECAADKRHKSGSGSMTEQGIEHSERTPKAKNRSYSVPGDPGRQVQQPRASGDSNDLPDNGNNNFGGELPSGPPLYSTVEEINRFQESHGDEVQPPIQDDRARRPDGDLFAEDRPTGEGSARKQDDDRFVEGRPTVENGAKEPDVVHRSEDDDSPEEEQQMVADRHAVPPCKDSFDRTGRPPARAPFREDRRGRSEGYEESNRARVAAGARRAHIHDEDDDFLDEDDPQDAMVHDDGRVYDRRRRADDSRQAIRSPVASGKGAGDHIPALIRGHLPSQVPRVAQLQRQADDYGGSRSRGPIDRFRGRKPEYDSGDDDLPADYLEDSHNGGATIRGHQAPDYRGQNPGRVPPVPRFGDDTVRVPQRDPVPSFNSGGILDRSVDYGDERAPAQGFGYVGPGLRGQGSQIREPTVRGRFLPPNAGYGGHGMHHHDHDDEYDTDVYEPPRTQGSLRSNTLVLHRQDGPARRPADMAVSRPVSRGPTSRGRSGGSDHPRHSGVFEPTARNRAHVRDAYGPSGIGPHPRGRRQDYDDQYEDDVHYAGPPVDDEWPQPKREYDQRAEEISRQQHMDQRNYRRQVHNLQPHQRSRRENFPLQKHQQRREVSQGRPVYSPVLQDVAPQEYALPEDHRQSRNEQQLRPGRPVPNDDHDETMQPLHTTHMQLPNRPRDDVASGRLGGPSIRPPGPRTSRAADGRTRSTSAHASDQVNPPSDGQNRGGSRARNNICAANEVLTRVSYTQEMPPRPRTAARPGDMAVQNLKRGGPLLSEGNSHLDGPGSLALDDVSLDIGDDCGGSFASRLDVSTVLHPDSIVLDQRGSVDTELSCATMRRQEFTRQRQMTKDYADSDSPQE